LSATPNIYLVGEHVFFCRSTFALQIRKIYMQAKDFRSEKDALRISRAAWAFATRRVPVDAADLPVLNQRFLKP
jgi:hypothetical protein